MICSSSCSEGRLIFLELSKTWVPVSRFLEQARPRSHTSIIIYIYGKDMVATRISYLRVIMSQVLADASMASQEVLLIIKAPKASKDHQPTCASIAAPRH